METVQAAVLIAGGAMLVALVVLARGASRWPSALLPVQTFLAMALLALGAATLMRGPLRILHGPPFLVFVLAAASYGAIAGGACLAFPGRVPRSLQTVFGVVCASGGLLLLLLRLRIIQPT